MISLTQSVILQSDCEKTQVTAKNRQGGRLPHTHSPKFASAYDRNLKFKNHNQKVKTLILKTAMLI